MVRPTSRRLNWNDRASGATPIAELGEMLDRYSDLHLVDYGFVWRRDVFAQDDLTWFLLEKR